MIRKILILVLVLTVPITALLTGVEIATKGDDFFYEQFQKNDVPQNTGMDLDNLMNVTDSIQDYLFGKRDDLEITAFINGEETKVFNQREIIHMEDVKVLFEKGILFRNMGAIVVLLAAAYGIVKRKRWIFKAFLLSVALYFAVGAILGGMLYVDFNKYFNLFHEIFFSNDYWILDPRDSILINMVPLNFFMSIVRKILLVTTILILATPLAFEIRFKFGGNHERYRNFRN
ncbi:TIGR01906 family membrane protein [Alkalibacter mobilis]|uniref:TIGR01906 family membrane protein n=1 Tax=Alkalibacter mobilis TaxID=2787712 RepID=UPI00189FDC40|nr:TIGR01906 family membrane protein [Alkalibacter mobilis]MBF7096609.1 TIGR01906 family membrane protein [Alkalibacter mobilis]